ncbi:MAG: DUF4465 domain-containing protein [Bacteroidia bacterium]|nr:DUF4465 domain-containing protein [Bacteroidia bacterium]
MKRTITVIALALSLFTINAQTIVADFEGLPLATNSAYSSTTGVSFTTGGASFQHKYSGYWSGGFSYTNKYDSSTVGFTNMYGVKPLKGYNNSNIYVIGQDKGVINLTAPSNTVGGFYITNTTYAYKSMKLGDSFGKKFGGVTGNDPDFFKVTVRGYKGGVLVADSVPFYLADFRFANNTFDYLVDTWQWVNTSTLGNVDSLKFFMFTSDNGSFGPNTPLFFGMDNFTNTQSSVGLAENKTNFNLSVYPNPFSSILTIRSDLKAEGTVALMDVAGKIIYSQQVNDMQTVLDVHDLPNGIYFLELSSAGQKTMKKLIKN